MPNYFYTDTDGQKRGPINAHQLKALVTRGIIVPTTPIETDTGHKGVAGQIKGLDFNTTTSFPQEVPFVLVEQKTGLYCTNCGNSITKQAVACMSCGAKPTGHRKFCRHCGVGLNPEQVICVKCGASVKTSGTSQSLTSISQSFGMGREKNRMMATGLAFLLGWCGMHKIYMGSVGWGIILCAIVVLTLGTGIFVTIFVAFFDGTRYLMMTDEAFAEKYPVETQAPFRW